MIELVDEISDQRDSKLNRIAGGSWFDDPEVLSAIQPDKTLDGDPWYLCWPSNGTDLTRAVLDGRFTAKNLRSIADYMEAHTPTEDK